MCVCKVVRVWAQAKPSPGQGRIGGHLGCIRLAGSLWGICFSASLFTKPESTPGRCEPYYQNFTLSEAN